MNSDCHILISDFMLTPKWKNVRIVVYNFSTHLLFWQSIDSLTVISVGLSNVCQQVSVMGGNREVKMTLVINIVSMFV